jgi:putative membrane protein
MTTRHFLLFSWDWHPALAAICVLVLLNYFVVYGASGRSRVWLVVLGLILFSVAMVSPVATLAKGYLFSAHMAQHLLLLLVVPALLLLGLPKWVEENPPPVEPPDAPNPTMNGLVLSWIAGVGAMWLWHIPVLCNAAATSSWMQGVQTVSLLLLGGLFWWPLLGPRRAPLLPPLAGVAYLSTACLACTLLGIYITFSPVAVCAAYHHPADPLGLLPLIRQGWGFTPALDQQVGGLLMWVPSCFVFLVGIIGQLALWYRGSEAEEVSAFADTAKADHTSSS